MRRAAEALRGWVRRAAEREAAMLGDARLRAAFAAMIGSVANG